MKRNIASQRSCSYDILFYHVSFISMIILFVHTLLSRDCLLYFFLHDVKVKISVSKGVQQNFNCTTKENIVFMIKRIIY